MWIVCLADVDLDMAKHSSLPAQYLYNWIFVCLSLIQHTKRMRLAENTEEKTKGMLPTGMTPDGAWENEEDEWCMRYNVTAINNVYQANLFISLNTTLTISAAAQSFVHTLCLNRQTNSQTRYFEVHVYY